MHIFGRISEGDLTVSSGDYVPDEFGELIRYLKRLIRKLKEVIHITIDSSQQLALSSENLSATSQDLAQGAQGQAVPFIGVQPARWRSPLARSQTRRRDHQRTR